MRREGEGWRLYRGAYPSRPRGGGDRPPCRARGPGPLVARGGGRQAPPFFPPGISLQIWRKKLHFGPVALWEGDRGIFLKFSKTDIYFWNFNFFKYKKEKTAWNTSNPSTKCNTGLLAKQGKKQTGRMLFVPNQFGWWPTQISVVSGSWLARSDILEVTRIYKWQSNHYIKWNIFIMLK